MQTGSTEKMTDRLFTLGWFLYGLIIFPVYLSVADQALGKAGLLPLPATVGGVIVLLPFVIKAIISSLWRGVSSPIARPLIANRGPVLVFALLAFWSLMLSLLPGAYWEESAKWIFLLSYGFIMALCALYVPRVPVIYRSIPLYTFIALSLLFGSMVYDLMYPGTFSTELTRAAGFPANSNYASLVAVVLCAASLDYLSRRPLWIDLAFITVTGLALLATMSRSGLVNFGVLITFYSYHRFIRGGVRWRQLMQLAVASIVLGTVAVAAIPLLMQDLAVFQGSTRLGRFLADEQVDDGSAASRLGAALDSLRLINDAPIFGHGTAYSRTMDELPHNLYLMQWVNNGLPGLLTYLGFLGVSYLVFKRRNFPAGQALILVAATGSAFSHNVLDIRPLLILWGILMTGSLMQRSSGTREIHVPLSQPAGYLPPVTKPLAQWAHGIKTPLFDVEESRLRNRILRG